MLYNFRGYLLIRESDRILDSEFLESGLLGLWNLYEDYFLSTTILANQIPRTQSLKEDPIL